MSAPSAYTPEQDAAIKTLHARGWTDAQIGAQWGKSAIAIKRRRQRLPMTDAERLVAGHRRKMITVWEAITLAARLKVGRMAE